MSASQAIMAAPFLSAGFALSFLGASRRQLSMQPLLIYWALLAAGIFSFCLINAVGDALGPFKPVFAFACSATCGMAWLLTRALFKPEGMRGRWPIALVAALYATGVLIDVLAGRPVSLLTQSVSNIHTLISSTVLLLTLFEPLEGLKSDLPEPEKRFRRRYVAGYALLFTCAVVLQREAGGDLNHFLDPLVIKVICAVAAIGGMSLAVWYRLNHPMPVVTASSRRSRSRTDTPQDAALGNRISALMMREELFTNPEIKVADLARALGEPDYKVSQAITGALGFQNFNRLINHHRIARAKEMLADTAFADQSILSVAMDCGFGSIGPFNRAFKDNTGMTPGAYRTAGVAAKPERA